VHPFDKINAVGSEEKEREGQEEETKIQKPVPHYFLHTNASVTKLANCENKSLKKRVKRQGLIEAITEDNRASTQKMRDIHKIAVNIDKVIEIEALREQQSLDASQPPLNPYLFKNIYEPSKQRVPVLQSSAQWVVERRRENEATNVGANCSPQTVNSNSKGNMRNKGNFIRDPQKYALGGRKYPKLHGKRRQSLATDD